MGLTKIFNKHTVVDNLDLKIEKSSILCLLGDNGSGKTTIINMLIGLIAPTSGNASVYGCNLLTDMVGVRDNIRVC